MGILDDAIREHIELKRRAGADPAEVERLEREAFGARERAAQAAAEAERAEHGAVEDGASHEHEDEVFAHVPAELDESRHAVEEAEPPAVVPESHAPEADDRPVEQPTRSFTLEELEDAQRREDAPEPPPPAAEPEPEPQADPVDELEETPDFLQETPEHERLWFEQKPPKDFDF